MSHSRIPHLLTIKPQSTIYQGINAKIKAIPSLQEPNPTITTNHHFTETPIQPHLSLLCNPIACPESPACAPVNLTRHPLSDSGAFPGNFPSAAREKPPWRNPRSRQHRSALAPGISGITNCRIGLRARRRLRSPFPPARAPLFAAFLRGPHDFSVPPPRLYALPSREARFVRGLF